MRPSKGSYPDYFDSYISLVREEDVIQALNTNWQEIQQFISSVPAEKINYAYAEGKWTIKQVLLHLTDTERIFAYRALRFARKDPQQVLSFDENHYAAAAETEHRTWEDLTDELETVRKASLSLFRSFSAETLLYSGNTAIGKTSVLALGYMICGHATHHLRVVQERYLKK